MDNHILGIIGFSGCGKDSIARVMETSKGYKFITSVTSRPMRSNESEGVEYYFKTNEQFQELIDSDSLIEYRSYNTIQDGEPTIWHYGITKDEINLEKGNHAVAVDIKGLEDLKEYFGDKVISVFVDVSEEARRLRAIARDREFELSEWKRRYKNDMEILKDIHKKVDFIVENYDFKKCIDDILKKINYMEKKKKFFNRYCSY